MNQHVNISTNSGNPKIKLNLKKKVQAVADKSMNAYVNDSVITKVYKQRSTIAQGDNESSFLTNEEEILLLKAQNKSDGIQK